MGLPRVVEYLFLALLLIGVVGLVMFVNQIVSRIPTPPTPTEVENQPAGLAYTGPQTTAIAGWYCIVELNSTPLPGWWGEPIPTGYSVQLNALLSNGAWVQDAMVPAQCGGPCTSKYVWTHQTQLWLNGKYTASLVTLPGPAACGWLVIAVVNGTAYVEYSLDGSAVVTDAVWVFGRADGEDLACRCMPIEAHFRLYGA